MSNAIGYALFALVAIVGIVGFVVFGWAGREARVELARQAGDSEASIERQRALLRKMRNYSAVAVAIAVVGAVWVSVAPQ